MICRRLSKAAYMDTNITFRPITLQDEGFLYRLYASTREDELAQVPWSASEKESFLRMQFALQHKYYLETFSSASFLVIELGERPIGRLYLDRREDRFHMIDVALLPEYRGGGIGTLLLQAFLGEAGAHNLPVTCYVEKYNRAQTLYKRLGFITIEDTEVHLLMEWKSGEK